MLFSSCDNSNDNNRSVDTIYESDETTLTLTSTPSPTPSPVITVIR